MTGSTPTMKAAERGHGLLMETLVKTNMTIHAAVELGSLVAMR